MGDDTGENMYLYVNHVQNNHYIALVIFEKSGEFESLDPLELRHFKETGKIKKMKIQRESGHSGSKKFIGQMITKEQVERSI